MLRKSLCSVSNYKFLLQRKLSPWFLSRSKALDSAAQAIDVETYAEFKDFAETIIQSKNHRSILLTVDQKDVNLALNKSLSKKVSFQCSGSSRAQ